MFSYKTSTSGARVDACNRCIDRLGLARPTPTPNRMTSVKTSMQNRTFALNTMLNSDKELAPDFHKGFNRVGKPRVGINENLHDV